MLSDVMHTVQSVHHRRRDHLGLSRLHGQSLLVDNNPTIAYKCAVLD